MSQGHVRKGVSKNIMLIEPDLDKMLGLAYEWYKNEKNHYE